MGKEAKRSISGVQGWVKTKSEMKPAKGFLTHFLQHWLLVLLTLVCPRIKLTPRIQGVPNSVLPWRTRSHSSWLFRHVCCDHSNDHRSTVAIPRDTVEKTIVTVRLVLVGFDSCLWTTHGIKWETFTWHPKLQFLTACCNTTSKKKRGAWDKNGFLVD